ncbi:MAG TPA: DUF4215 domain-containing protein, partial [Polyangiales bacterium]|nr:DUF4215 domain-containing protein [Polyangiales bacterium]
SNYKLTLSNFASSHSGCHTICGDKRVVGDEECDDGKNDGSYGSCTSTCMRGPFCGDKIVQKAHEECDDGLNLTTYSGTGTPGCAPSCKKSAYCGDQHVDSLFGEECDDGINKGGYGKCAKGCVLGPRCGDGVVQKDHAETCDDGNRVSGDGCAKDCLLEAPQ